MFKTPLVLTLALNVILPSLVLARSQIASSHNTLIVRSAEEPVVAVDPAHSSRVVIGSNPGPAVGKTYPPAYFFSRDGGRTFTTGSAPMPAPYTSSTDPSIAFARNGTVFYGYEVATPSYCNGPAGSGAIVVSAARDDGRAFRRPTVVDVNSSDDKPFIAVESVSSRKSHVFAVWTRYAKGTEIWQSRSLDGGVTFEPPVLVGTSPYLNIGAVPVVGPHGRIYVFWANLVGGGAASGTGSIMFAVSRDDGHTYGAARALGESFPTMPRVADPGQLRTVTLPAAVIGKDGRLFVAWTRVVRQRGPGLVDTDIVLSSSSNGGQTWSAPHPVNDVHTGDRFMPALAALPDGSVAVAFYDRRGDPTLFSVYVARASFAHGYHVSHNLQVNSGPARVTDLYAPKPENNQCYSPGRFFGDYLSVAAAPRGGLYITWADTQAHVYAEIDVWLAKVRVPVLSAR